MIPEDRALFAELLDDRSLDLSAHISRCEADAPLSRTEQGFVEGLKAELARVVGARDRLGVVHGL